VKARRARDEKREEAGLNGHSDSVSFIWSVAELLRGDYKAADYGKVILPFTVLRRLDCLLELTKDAVLKAARTLPEKADPTMREALLNRAAGQGFHNAARFTFALLRADPAGIEANLRAYLNGFSANIQDIFISHFDLPNQIARLERSNLLYLIIQKFAEIDLHPERVSNLTMGTIFEDRMVRCCSSST
jgi:type I restriction enzyme M protein